MGDETPDFLNRSSRLEPEALPVAAPAPAAPTIYQGNSYDLAGLIMASAAVVILLSCGTFGLASYCLPLVALIGGIISLRLADKSLDPLRTKRLAWLSIGVGGLILLAILSMVAFFAIAAIASESGGF
jgi:hypothetical protein